MTATSKIYDAKIVSPTKQKLHVANIIGCARRLGYRGFKEHIQFFVAAVLHRDAFLKLTQHNPGTAFGQLILDRPQYASLLTAPYIDARWSSSMRVDRLMEHAAILQGPLAKYSFPGSQSLHLLDLAELSVPDYHIVIDKPMWFCHEGLITLNLFKGDFRFFSVTFSFYSKDGAIGLIVGGVQGRRTDNILAQYREFTKIAHGLRPRDFIFEVLRMVARAENAEHIVGVPDRFRYHRQGYFAKDNREELHLNYDEIWLDRGGVLNEDGMYEIPLNSARTPDRTSAKKRGMYRRRYDFLNILEAKIVSQLQTVVPIASGRAD